MPTSHGHHSVSVSDVLGITALEATKRMYLIKMHGAMNVLKLFECFEIIIEVIIEAIVSSLCLKTKYFYLSHDVPTIQNAEEGPQ